MLAPAILLNADTISVDLLVTKRTEIYKAKTAENPVTSGHTIQNGIDGGMMKIEEGGRRELLDLKLRCYRVTGVLANIYTE